MIHRFYNKFIRPTSTDINDAERETVLNYLLVGTLILAVTALIINLFGLLASNVPLRLSWLLEISIFIILITGLYVLARVMRRHTAAAVILTAMVAFFGCATASTWSIWDPHGILLISLAVIMAGVLIGARYSLYTVAIVTVVLIYLQKGEEDGFLHPDRHWLATKPILGDALGISAMLFIIALISWLFNRQMETSLDRAQRSEKALQRQKLLLEVKAEARAQQLEAAQLEKMQELYRFAELGRLSTALFHDLANHISTVSLDIEGLSKKDQTDMTRRIGENVGHIDDIVQRVRQQIRGKDNIEVFNVSKQIDEVIKILGPMVKQARVRVYVKAGKSIKPSLSYKGDTIRFRQIILNLVMNAAEAYPANEAANLNDRPVTITLKRKGTELTIEVTDHGIGIPVKDRDKIFRPFYTTKKQGSGIGLFIVQQVVEHDFKGSLELLDSNEPGTTFKVSLPKSYYVKK